MQFDFGFMIFGGSKSRLGRDEPHVGCGQKEKRLKYVKYPPLYVECDIIQFFHIQTERIFDNKNVLFYSVFCCPFSVLLFWYSSFSIFFFRLQQLQTFQNTSETYKYKYNPLKQILFLSSFYNLHTIHIHFSTHNTIKTRKNRLKIPQNQYFSALFPHILKTNNFYIMQKIRFSFSC